MHNIETVRIKSGDSYAIINADDFDESVHERYDNDNPPQQAKKKRKAEAPFE